MSTEVTGGVEHLPCYIKTLITIYILVLRQSDHSALVKMCRKICAYISLQEIGPFTFDSKYFTALLMSSSELDTLPTKLTGTFMYMHMYEARTALNAFNVYSNFKVK